MQYDLDRDEASRRPVGSRVRRLGRARARPRTTAGLELDVEIDGRVDPGSGARDTTGGCCAFVDGVRRIDVRLFAEDESMPRRRRSPARGRSAAAWSSLPPRISTSGLGRELVVGGGLAADALSARVGGRCVALRPRSVTGDDPARSDPGAAERDAGGRGRRSRRTSSPRGGADLVVSDGPLTYFASGPAVGLIKRQARAYLDGERRAGAGTARRR